MGNIEVEWRGIFLTRHKKANLRIATMLGESAQAKETNNPL